ncbi:MAG: DUF6622 family protein [Burkholderiales bacterium]
MILQILQRTPPWVFVLFVALLVLGALQYRPRELGRPRVALMPAIFLPLSMWVIWNAFGPSAFAYGGWLAGIGAALLLNHYTRLPRQVSYSADTRRFRVEGSWIPLSMMMAIFFTRYAIAVATAMQPELKGMPAFAAAVGFAYGLFSGSFLARALRILAAAH